ncbi:MAG: glucose-1-phosphate adenylyltransferase subunit GlgD [Lachnospiraceae bacterium]|nr:glucose-1-phosphate adenylyltransferase subunit GlgD [Lachnospiraceae bacterium]
MVNSNADALGIIFPNSYDSLVPELVSERLMASIPFGGRYRMVDFILSSMVNCGIDNVSIIVRKNYHSLMDHLGSGREWDLTRKNGGLNIVPPFAEKNIKIYNGRVEALASVLSFLQDQKEKYVVMADANIAANFDFRALIDAHVASKADVTIAYTEDMLPETEKEEDLSRDFFYTLKLNGTRVEKIYVNLKEDGPQNFSTNIYVIDRELLINQIHTAFVRGLVYFERDILAPRLDRLNVQAFKYEGYAARITNMRSYFEENMKLLDDKNLDALFEGNPIYTKIRDDNPTRYINGSKGTNILVADGCVIEGEVENSILFRGVKIKKGARVKNCILMQDTEIGENAHVEYVITDKNATISAGKEIKGTDTFQVFVAKYQTV